MSIFDDLSGLYSDANAWLAESGVADFVDTALSDFIPGFNTLQSILGVQPTSGETYYSQQQNLAGASGQWPAPVPSAVQYAGGAGGVFSGGTMDFPLTTMNGMGRLPMVIPYSGGLVPSGYRVRNLPGRRPTAGRAPGVYLTRSRRMNPLNPKALSRAERRMSSFTRYVKKHFQTTNLMPKRKTRSRKRR